MANTNDGWFILSRKEDDLYFDEPFTRWMAWQDLIRLACFKPYKSHIRGILVEHKRGCVYESQDNLAKRWQWSRGKVLRFLKELEQEERIVQQKSNVINCISVVNYDKYQSCSTPNDTPNDTSNSTADSTPNGTTQKEDINKIKEDINKIKELYLSISGLSAENPTTETKKEVKKFVKPTIEELKEYSSEIGFKDFDANYFYDYYESNGWKVGKNSMKDWKATIRTWKKNESNSTSSKPKIKPATCNKPGKYASDISSNDYKAGWDRFLNPKD